MVQRLCCFLVVSLLIFNGEVFGQNSSVQIVKDSVYFLFKSPEKTPIFSVYSKFSDVRVVRPGCWGSVFPKIYVFNLTSGKLYTDQLGFFCKKELQLDKITPVPIRFRLGSLQYVNWLEQKPSFDKLRTIKPGL